VVASQIKMLDALLATIRDLEAGRRGLEVSLVAIADQRAAQAAERVMRGSQPNVTGPPHTKIRTGERRTLVPWANQLATGGHLERPGGRGTVIEGETDDGEEGDGTPT